MVSNFRRVTIFVIFKHNQWNEANISAIIHSIASLQKDIA